MAKVKGGKRLPFGFPIIMWLDRFAYFGNGWACEDCGSPFDMYMVEDKIWKKAKLTQKNNVCLACLSAHLKRPLTVQDFSDAPVNGPVAFLKNQPAA